MNQRFSDRREAGKRLAAVLRSHAGRADTIVLGLPRGGVPVAAVVARTLGLPLDLFVVRKLGVPGQEELAMGALASGGVRVLNRPVIETLGIRPEDIERVTRSEVRELARRESVYRGDRPPLNLRGKTVILVDDGIATGSTVRAAVAALRAQGVGRLVVATPTIAADTYDALRPEVDDLVAVTRPLAFHGVGAWYDDFGQTTDDEVREALRSIVDESKSSAG